MRKYSQTNTTLPPANSFNQAMSNTATRMLNTVQAPGRSLMNHLRPSTTFTPQTQNNISNPGSVVGSRVKKSASISKEAFDMPYSNNALIGGLAGAGGAGLLAWLASEKEKKKRNALLAALGGGLAGYGGGLAFDHFNQSSPAEVPPSFVGEGDESGAALNAASMMGSAAAPGTLPWTNLLGSIGATQNAEGAEAATTALNMASNPERFRPPQLPSRSVFPQPSAQTVGLGIGAPTAAAASYVYGPRLGRVLGSNALRGGLMALPAASYANDMANRYHQNSTLRR